MQDGTTWREQAFLIVGKPGSADYFRSSVAMSGRTVVVGAYADASSTTGVNSIPNEAAYDSGAAYIYAPPGQAPTITSAATATATVGQSFTYNITASNSPTTYGAANLPTGLSVNTSTGVISGTPTTLGTYTITVSARNAGGEGNQTLTLTVTSPPLITINYIDAVGFVLIFNGDKNQAAVLQYTTDFKQWFPLATKGVGEKDLVHLDPLGAQVPYRFYRVVKQ